LTGILHLAGTLRETNWAEMIWTASSVAFYAQQQLLL